MKISLKKAAVYSLSFLGLLALPVGAFQLYLLATGNVHTVVAGEYYRSAQPKPGAIATAAQEHGLKSVINLRGRHPGAKWYEAEKREAEAAGVQMIDFRMSDGEHMTHAEAFKLIDVLRDAPKPVLVHCLRGADRTGLASALYLAAIKKDTEFNAELQLSLLYGHLPLYFNKSYAMNMTFEDMEPLIGYTDS